MKKAVSVTPRMLRSLINEAIQGRNPGDPLFSPPSRRLSEAGPEAMRVDMSIMSDVLDNQAHDIGISLSQATVERFQTQIARVIATEMSKHSMALSPIDPRSFVDEIEEANPDVVIEAREQCVFEMTSALKKFANVLGEMGVFLAGGREADEGF